LEQCVLTAIEALLNCAEAVLAGTVKNESAAPIAKHNGASDNGNVTEWRESARNPAINAVDLKEAECRATSDEIMYKSMNLSEADTRKLRNLPPVGSPNLTATQLREYRLMRTFRIAEADALKLALKVA
jgi:hypothetical protein